MDSLKIGQDLSGLRVMDIGAYDGPMSFELAQRGAEVLAVDVRKPSETGFNALREISGIDIPYCVESVYNLKYCYGAEFDIVLFLGVFYHLQNPLLAFENVAHVLRSGGMAYIEGASFGTYIEDETGTPINPERLTAAIDAMEMLEGLDVPVCLAYPGTYLKGNNWFIPNRSALRGWIRSVGLDPENVYSVPGQNGQRRVGARARKP